MGLQVLSCRLTPSDEPHNDRAQFLETRHDRVTGLDIDSAAERSRNNQTSGSKCLLEFGELVREPRDGFRQMAYSKTSIKDLLSGA